MVSPKKTDDDAEFIDPEYQTFTMQDFDQSPAPLLTRVDYLVGMFDLEVQNEQGKPIVITLREKAGHFDGRQQLVRPKCPECLENASDYDLHASCLDEHQSRAES